MKINEMAKSYFKKMHDKHLLKRSVCQYSKYLRPGFYNCLKQYNCIYLQDETVDHISLIKGYFKTDIINKKILIKNQHKSNYTCMLICNNGKTFKFFDFENKILFTIFKSKRSMEDFLGSRPEIFPSSEILEIDDKLFSIKESLLIDEAKSTEGKFVELIKFENNFYKDKNPSNFNSSSLEESEKCRKTIIERFHKYFSDSHFDISNVPSIFQHGDAWDANLFIDNRLLKFIDFDRVGEYPILFDPFLFAYTEGFFKKNNEIVYNWLNGKYDKYFRENQILENTNFKSVFVLNCYIMMLMRHEIKGDYSISDEIISYLKSVGLKI